MNFIIFKGINKLYIFGRFIINKDLDSIVKLRVGVLFFVNSWRIGFLRFCKVYSRMVWFS